MGRRTSTDTSEWNTFWPIRCRNFRFDGRFHPDNKAWANRHYVPEDSEHNACFVVRSHPAVLDGFITEYRKLVMGLGLFDQKHCEPDSREQDYTGKVLALSTDTLREACWSPQNQLWLVI